MATGYVDTSSATMITGATIEASHHTTQFANIGAFAHRTTGHNHDGTTGGGAPIPLATAVSGTLPVANGGTGLTSGTSGGILAFTASGTLASSGALTASALVLGGGAGVAPTAMGSLGTTTTVLHGNAAGAPTFGAVALATDVSGTLPVANGGTGLTSGTSGGILAYTASGTLASSAALTANQIVIGGGAGVVPATLGSLGTTTTVLHGNASGAPTFGAVSLTADVSGILPTANGGTGIAYFTAAGPTTARVYTFPDAADTVVCKGTASVFTAQQNFGTATLTDGATIDWNMATQQVAKVTLGGNRTMAAPTNLVDGGTYILRIIQDGTGSRTITWNSVFKWPAATAPTLTTTAAAIDIITFVSDGTNLYGQAVKAFG